MNGHRFEIFKVAWDILSDFFIGPVCTFILLRAFCLSMHRLSTLILQYYRLLLLNNTMFSLMVGTAAYVFVGRISFGLSMFVKLLGFAAATGHYYYMYRKSYYYYQNAGLSARRLYLYSFALDIGLSAIILTLISLWYRSV